MAATKKKGLYANIHAKRERIAKGSGEKMRKPGAKGAPKSGAFKKAAKTAGKQKTSTRLRSAARKSWARKSTARRKTTTKR